jgi:hypothetical protein
MAVEIKLNAAAPSTLRRYKHDVDTRAAKAEEERRRLELQAIQRAAEERDYRAATLLQVCFLLLFLVLYSTHNMMP